MKNLGNYLFVLLLVLATRSLLADDFKTIDGKEYKHVTVSRIEPDGIVLITSSGISKIYFTELPKEVQERFHYDPAKGTTYSSQQAANQEAFQKQEQAAQKKRTEEREKYWRENPTPEPERRSSANATANSLTGTALDRPAYGQSTTAEYMLSRYATNQMAADKEYKGRIFTINGTIKSISSSEKEVAVELVAPSTFFSSRDSYYNLKGAVWYMRCIFSDSSGLEQFQSGNPISLTGTVAGVSGRTLIIEDCRLAGR